MMFGIAARAVLMSVFLVAPCANAQTPAKMPKLGILDPHPAAAFKTKSGDRISDTMRKLGWIEGENLIIERAYAEGNEDRIAELAAELVRKKVDVIWASGQACTLAAARATKTIPIVFWGASPQVVEAGLADSLARPGRNITGIAFVADMTVPERTLQYLKEIAPSVTRLAWIRQTAVPGLDKNVAALIAAAKGMGIEVDTHYPRRVEDFDPVFAAIRKSGAHAIFHYGSTLTMRERKRIADFALKNGLASAFGMRDYVEAGGLLSYGADFGATWPRAFGYVDRILRGARPSDLPVDLPSVYELVINTKTARALNLTIPKSLLVRADKLIE